MAGLYNCTLPVDTDRSKALATDLASNEQQDQVRATTEAHEALVASADYQRPVDQEVVRNARMARLSVVHDVRTPHRGGLGDSWIARS